MMQEEQKLLDRLSSYLYKLERIRQIDSKESENIVTNAHTLLLFQTAKGEISIEGQIYALHRHKVILLPPRTAVTIAASEDHAIHYCEIEFHAFQFANNRVRPARLNLPIEWPAVLFQSLMDSVSEIAEKQGGSGLDKLKASIRFQEMIVTLFHELFHEPESMQELAVATTMDYMDRNYVQNITREQLAEMAALSADHYYRIFKKSVGKTPLEYLTSVRMNRAKQQLLVSQDSFRSIARSVGINDEFYFSRKFKAVTGLSPSAYVSTMKRAGKIVSLHHSLTGHLLALGIEPYAALVNNYYPVAQLLPNTVAIGTDRPDLEKLIAVQPDMIFTFEAFDTETSHKIKMLEQIAPTVTISFFDDWRSQLQDIARATGKEKETAAWLDRYEGKAAAVRRAVQSECKGDTVLIIGIGYEELCIFGRRNVGAVIYGDLQLAVSPQAAGIDHYLEVTFDEVFGYEADHIILTSFRNDGSAETKKAIAHTLQRFYKDPRWRAFEAVKRSRVYSIFENQHLYTLYTSYSNDLLLDQLSGMLIANMCKD